jgi:hypothetical protein
MMRRNEDEVELTEVVLAEAEESEAKERDSSAFAGGTNWTCSGWVAAAPGGGLTITNFYMCNMKKLSGSPKPR